MSQYARRAMTNTRSSTSKTSTGTDAREKVGKTLSNKAKKRLVSGQVTGQASGKSSRFNSTANSRSGSRAASRAPSDDEGGDLSDETSYSINSIDELLATNNTYDEDIDGPPDVWRKVLADRIEQLIDRKHSSLEKREEALAAYSHILLSQYAKEEITRKLNELLPTFLKSVKAESSEKETVLALKALAITLITDPSDSLYEALYQPVKRALQDSESSAVKAAAIRTLGTATFYGGASLEETEDVMRYLQEIIESDGSYVDAEDDAVVVTAALEEWGFLATQLDDMEDMTEEAIDALVEQLDSSDAGVAIAAGENIALLYEKSYTPLEEDEEEESDDGILDEDEDPRDKMVQRYKVYRLEKQLKEKLDALATVSSHSISKKDKKSLRSNFTDILHSVENPTHGPKYQRALNADTGRAFGAGRMAVRIHQSAEMRIDKWWKMLRLKALRRVLGGGFIVHYEYNEVVFGSLPIMVESRGRR